MKHARQWILLAGACAACMQWLGLHHGGAHLTPPWQAWWAGVGVFGAAVVLSWGAELAQLEIPQALALAFLALVAVLPEYAVDMYFAWKAGQFAGIAGTFNGELVPDIGARYASYAAANMTGSNRLLIGFGWVTIILAYWWKTRRTSITLEPTHRIELLALAAATAYSFVIPIKGTLNLIDTFVLLLIFTFYMVSASRARMEEPDLEGPTEIIARIDKPLRRLITFAFFALSGYTIYQAAEPFAEGLVATGRQFGIEEFLLVQWLAPLASESPEFIVAILFALRLKPGAGLGTVVSSKVNQWTLLVGMIPLVYCISSGRVQSMHLDGRQVEEILLTAAQSFFALVTICNLEFSMKEGLILAALFGSQLFFTDPKIRYAYSAVYIVLGIWMLAADKDNRRAMKIMISDGWRKSDG